MSKMVNVCVSRNLGEFGVETMSIYSFESMIRAFKMHPVEQHPSGHFTWVSTTRELVMYITK